MVPHSSICANSKSAEFANSPEFLFPGRQSGAKSAWLGQTYRHHLTVPQGHLRPAMAAGTDRSVPDLITLSQRRFQAIQNIVTVRREELLLLREKGNDNPG